MNIDYFLNQLQNIFLAMQKVAPMALILILGLWFIHFLNVSLRYKLNQYGIIPRRWRGLPGILLSPFLHGHFSHLFFNSIPLFVLLSFILMNGWKTCLAVTFALTLMSGSLLWLSGRRGIHIGASALIMGYWGYLLADAVRYPSISTLLLAFICLYYFGGLLLSIFPSEKQVSWEGHLFGFVAGLAVACFPLATNFMR